MTVKLENNPPSAADRKPRAYVPEEYWSAMAEAYAQRDPAGFSPVLHPGAPDWFNALIDRLQSEAWLRALSQCALSSGALVLEVGCGTGRWLRRLTRLGFRPVGIDLAPAMLRWAAGPRCSIPLVAAEAQRLPFASGSFGCVCAITVLQHIPLPGQKQAIREMVRVLAPGGYLILLDLQQSSSPHLFAHSPEERINNFSAAGVSLVCWFGQEFLLLDRLFIGIARAVRRLSGKPVATALPGDPGAPSKGASVFSARALYWGLRRIPLTVSSWIEPVARRVCSRRWATHGVFVFRNFVGEEAYSGRSVADDLGAKPA